MADRAKQGILIAVLLLSILWIHYGLARHESFVLISSYSVGFAAYLWLLRQRLDPKWVISLGGLLRIALVFGTPNLSEDVYRFIWDGHLLHAGIHPFSATPEQINVSTLFATGISDDLYTSLNSQQYATIYPPLSQAVFWLATFSTDLFTNITIIRLIILLFEFGCIYLLQRYFNPNNHGTILAIYALNPLVILELTGNLHFEGIMVFFILLSIIMIRNKHRTGTALSFALGIGVKLVPLMLLPSLIRKISTRNALIVYTLIGTALLVIFAPITNASFLSGMSSSLSLFFQKFEFNAGLFFMIREIGFLTAGYDLVRIVGPVFSVVSLTLILWYSFKHSNAKTDLTQVFSGVLMIQFAFSMVVHPWYVVPLIALTVQSGYIFPIIWSFFIFMTYAGYGESSYEHPMIWIGIEYVVVGYLAWQELFNNKKYQWVNG